MAESADPEPKPMEISFADDPEDLVEYDPEIVNPCRLCFTSIDETDKTAKSLFKKEKGGIKLSSHLKRFFQLEFEESWLWPDLVCGNCVSFIKQMQDFKGKIMTTHCTLYRSIAKHTPTVKERILKKVKKQQALKMVKSKEKTVLIKKRAPEEDNILIAHMRTLDVLRCDICRDKKFVRWDDLTTHLTLHHSLPSPYIFCCKARYEGRDKAFDHMDWHLNPDAFKCFTCSAQFQNYSQLTRHEISARHGEPKYKCSTCQLPFQRISKLKSHEASHLPVDQRPFTCAYCSKRFVSMHSLRRHIDRIHEVSDRFQCETCGRKFSEKGYLWMHQKSHDPEWMKKKREKYLNKRQRTNMTVRARSRIPAEHESQKCQYCEYTTRNMRHHMINQHITKYKPTEEEAKIVACETCGKEMEQFKMPRHKRRHEFQPKTCTICDMVLNSDSAYFSHMAMHKQRSYPCSHCPMVFHKAWVRYSHFRQSHPVEFQLQYKGTKWRN